MSGPDRRGGTSADAAGLQRRLIHAAHLASLRMTRAGDASLARQGGPLRRDGRLTRVFPFGLIAVVSLILTLVPSGAVDAEGAHPESAVTAAILFGLIIAAALILPWDSWPAPWQAVVPFTYMVVVALVVHAQGGDGAGYTILYILPVAWLALYGPRWQLATALVAAAALILLPPWVDEWIIGEDHYTTDDYILTLVILLIILFMAAALRLATDAASRDALTGLPNRRVFMATLRRHSGGSITEDRPLSLAMLDLDHFKAFNDSRGHDAGDRLLAATAERWSRALRDRDMLARVGGEEFGLIVECDVGEAQAIVTRLLEAVPDGQTASAGVAGCPPGTDPAAALKAADVALYAAKDAGRARMVVAPAR